MAFRDFDEKPVSSPFSLSFATLLRSYAVVHQVRRRAAGERPDGGGRRATAGLRRFVDRKMIVSRGLSACKRASRSGSWICGIDGPSHRVASRRPAGRHAEFAGTNRQRIDSSTRRSSAAAHDLSPKSIGISIYLSHSLIPLC